MTGLAVSVLLLVVAESLAFPWSAPQVAVAGATGRTGRLVVEELLSRGIGVVALARDKEKANEVLPAFSTPGLSVLKCDLGSEEEILAAVKGCDAAIWCATGFSEDSPADILSKIKSLFGGQPEAKRSIDSVALACLGKAFRGAESEGGRPQVIMCSSAGVTRPAWANEKKEKFKGAADIPIVRLNPFNILGAKADSERTLRDSGANYCIVRPCGLNDDWPSGSRPIFSQGDVGVGRINRKDVAKVLVDCLDAPESVGKTFEIVALAGNYPPPPSIRTALARLKPDSEAITDGELEVTYAIMQQLLPGEKQDSAALAMGQTYEELDQGKTGRFGKRGQENAEAVAPKPSS